MVCVHQESAYFLEFFLVFNFAFFLVACIINFGCKLLIILFHLEIFYIVLYRWKTVYSRPNTLVAVSSESVVQQPLPLSKMDFVLVGRMPGKPVICQ